MPFTAARTNRRRDRRAEFDAGLLFLQKATMSGRGGRTSVSRWPRAYGPWSSFSFFAWIPECIQTCSFRTTEDCIGKASGDLWQASLSVYCFASLTPDGNSRTPRSRSRALRNSNSYVWNLWTVCTVLRIAYRWARGEGHGRYDSPPGAG